MSDIILRKEAADYNRLGLKPDQIEMWEDGRRDQAVKGHWEWWYFDALLDDGSQLVLQFFPKEPSKKSVEDSPSYRMTLTLPDGRVLKKNVAHDVKDCYFGKDKADLRFGQSSFTGDLHTYHIKADVNDSKEHIGADITLVSQSKPYRPETGYFTFDNDDYYTWFCTVPSGEVTGTVTYDGKTIPVHGRGYHDHQWGSATYHTLWNHWTWARQKFGDYTLLVFDMIGSESHGFKRYPLVFLEDDKGNVIFHSNEGVDYDYQETYQDDYSGKTYPSSQRFVFKDGDKTLIYELKQKQIIENMKLPFLFKMAVKLKGMNPSYARYVADGHMTLLENGQEIVSRKGELIYEFMYPGKVDFREAVKKAK